MVISEEWSSYREDDTMKANFVKEKIVDDEWWEKVSYILSFTEPIYEIIRVSDTDKPCLHLVYEMWDSIIEKAKIEIYKKERRQSRWVKNNTPLHCLAHYINPRYYSDAWLLEDSTRISPQRDGEISQERMKCFKRLIPNNDEYNKVLDEYTLFERRWSTYAFIHSLRRNKLNTSRAEDLVYVHNNLRLLSRNRTDDVKIWDVGGDAFDSMEDVGFLVVADLAR
ncbi:uncharacterized protein LOC143589995 [Bidens hawaiensis]|uniref:uncharacterized protein LOC143589995 n=1 Tax=Bidens hawaiensis TaxID=980011 RepID=UPI00404B48AA